MKVTNCSDSFPHLCESKNGQDLYLEESLNNGQWVYTIRICPKTGKAPTTFIGNGINFVFSNSSRSWWTSVVRDLVIRNSSESRTIKVTPIDEGFLKTSNGIIALEFIPAWAKAQKMFVACMSGKESTPEVKDAKETTRSKERASYMMSTSTHETTTALLPSGKESTPEVKDAEETTRSKERASTMMSPSTHETTTALLPSVLTIILPVGLSILALITMVTLSAVCWRRSNYGRCST